MKHIEFKTSKGEFLVKEYSSDKGKAIAAAMIDKFCGRMKGYKFIGRIPDITEDQAKEVVDKVDWYYNYNYTVQYRRNMFNTAIESLNSILKVNGVCFESTYPDYDQALKHYETHLYWEAQQRVWNKEKAYLFKKI